MLIYSHNKRSKGAKALSKELGARRIKHNSTTFIGRAHKWVINWGNSELPQEVMKCQVINDVDGVRACADKRHFFRTMKLSVAKDWIIPNTEDQGAAEDWLGEGHSVVCRTILNGHSGDGIVIVDEGCEMIEAPLYTLYKKKAEEFRVHVAKGHIIDIQRKARNTDVANPNWQIRSHANGFIYARNNIEVPEVVKDAVICSLIEMGLDFGAVDVIWNEKEQRAYVLEINTAPGLEGQTVESYAKFFKEYVT